MVWYVNAKNKRKAMELTQKELALKVGVHPQKISRVENGFTCTKAIRDKIMEVLDGQSF